MAKLTDEQLAPIYRYCATKFQEQKIDARNPMEVIKWMVENPLPTPEEVRAEHEVEDEAEKQRRIIALTEELEKLEGR